MTDVAFSRDGSLLASAASDRTVAVWNVATGDRAELLEGHGGDVTSVAFGPDGTTVFSASRDGAVLAWDRAGDRRFVSAKAAEGELLARRGLGLQDHAFVSPNGGAVLSIVSARCGAQLVVSGPYGSVQRLDAETLAPKSEQSEYFTGWLTSVYADPEDPEVDLFAMVTSATGRDVTVNEDQREDRLLLIDAASEQTMHDLELSFDGEHADISPDGARVAVTGDGGQVGVIDIAKRHDGSNAGHRPRG